MAKTAIINIRAEAETKAAVEALFRRFGITLSDAVNIFFSKALMEEGLPFEVKLPKEHITTRTSTDMLPTGFATKITNSLRALFGDTLCELRLYGSFARGQQSADSDVDLAAMVRLPRAKIATYRAQIAEIASALSLEYERLISIHCIAQDDYAQWEQDLPYYRTIKAEGVRIDIE